MTQLWSVRIYKEDDELGILELMKLSGIERTSEEWLWQYKNNPLGHLIGVAEYSGKIVGHMALVPTYMKIGDKAITGSQAVDLVVHPEFRRQGMFLAIGEFLTKEAGKEGIDISYGFPNKPAHSGHLKYGWFDISEAALLIKPVNMNKIVNYLSAYRMIRFLDRYKISRKVLKYVFQSALTIINFFYKIFDRIEEDNNRKNVEIRAIESFDDRIDDFWKKISRDYTIIVIRDKRYLNWRYFKKPNVKHTVLLAEKNGEIFGYIILRSRDEKNSRVGYIVDIFASLDDHIVIQSLISKAIEHFIKENADLIKCWVLKNSSSARLFRKILRFNGFVHFFARSQPLITRLNSSKLSRTLVGDSKKWYITMGDSDHI